MFDGPNPPTTLTDFAVEDRYVNVANRSESITGSGVLDWARAAVGSAATLLAADVCGSAWATPVGPTRPTSPRTAMAATAGQGRRMRGERGTKDLPPH